MNTNERGENMKKGISLIVLVITIIVMIILAAAVIISMSNNGIIDRASQAVQLTDEKQVQDLAALLWAEAYLDPAKKADIVNVVTQELAKQGVTTTDWNITVSNTGVVITAKNSDVVISQMIIVGTYYDVEVGMTWEQWVASKYNTGGFVMHNGTVRTASKTEYVTEDGIHSVSGVVTTGVTYRLEAIDVNTNPPSLGDELPE